VGIALAALTLIVGTLGFYYRHMDARFAQEGVPAQATVLIKKLEENTNSDPRFLLQLGYADEQQKSQQGWVAIPRPLWESLHQGQAVDVTYLRADPSKVRLADPSLHETGQLQLKLATVCLIGAALSFAAWWWKARRPDSP